MTHSHAKGYLLELANRPDTEGWYKDLIVKVLNNNGVLSDNDLIDTINLLKNGGQSVLPLPSAVSTATANAIRLVSLKHNSGVCALSEKQEIQFSKDITLLYGLNGTGKSSYFRILNEMVGGNRQQKIRSNIYIGQNPAVDVELVYENQGGIHTISWDGKSRAISDLAGVSVFDSNYTNSFLEKRSADMAIVHPYGLYLFTSLSDSLGKINQSLLLEIDNLKSNLPEINLKDLSNMVKTVITTAHFDVQQKEYIQEHYVFTEQNNVELEQLNSQIKQLTETNYADKINLETANKSQYDRLLQFVKVSCEELEEKVNRLHRLIDALKGSRQKADETKVKIAILQEIGHTESPEWKMFVKSADSFAHKSGLPDDICPYCRQSLSDRAKNILESYAVFLNNNSLLELELLEKEKDNLRKSITAIQTEYSLPEYFSNLIQSQNENLLGLINRVLSHFSQIKSTLLIYLQEESVEPVQMSNEVQKLILDLSKISSHYSEMLSDLKLKNENKEQMLNELKVKQTPLLERKSISDQKEQLQRWFRVQDKIHVLRSLQAKLSTRSISHLAKNASRELITNNLFSKFRDELKALGLDKLDVNLKEEASKGLLYMQLKLHHNHEVTEILSEGEQKGVALALFLAERQMEVAKSPIIMDDPINSLDHCITYKLAERLVSLENQIIIFSHHLLFKSSLLNLSGLHECGVNQYASCHKTSRHLYFYKVWDYGRDQKGVVFENKQDNAANTLAAVKTELGKKPFQNQDSIAVGAQLRHVIELLIDEKVFKGQIPLGFHGRKNSIPWEQLKGMNPDTTLIDKLKVLFSRLSGGRLHLGVEQSENPIDHAELESIYNELKEI